jgi:GNAT superfamily N-acetyltransferase
VKIEEEFQKLATVTVRQAYEFDIPAVVDLLNEIDEFYGDEVSETAEDRADKVASVLFGDYRTSNALLAIDGSQAVGFASYSYLWPAAGSSRSLYLKELYVSDARRNSGIGRLMMESLFDIARKERCSRVEWTTDVSNKSAQNFYEKLGESIYDGKLFYRHEID